MTETTQFPAALTHCGTETITTPRLTLRRFVPEDAQAMFDNWANDERVTRFLTWTPHGSPEQTQRLVDMWCDEYDKPAYYQWAIEYDGSVIGSISVVRQDERARFAELGYCMGFDWWGSGLMTEAAGAVIDYLFERCSFNCVRISHAVKNPASGRVAQKCGLILEGIHRQYFLASWGEFLDIAEYSILREEWEQK